MHLLDRVLLFANLGLVPLLNVRELPVPTSNVAAFAMV
jgi:hypothetical protein